MRFPVLVHVYYPGHKPTDHLCHTKESLESVMARARNSTATKIQVFEFAYSLNLQSEWATSPTPNTTQE